LAPAQLRHEDVQVSYFTNITGYIPYLQNTNINNLYNYHFLFSLAQGGARPRGPLLASHHRVSVCFIPLKLCTNRMFF